MDALDEFHRRLAGEKDQRDDIGCTQKEHRTDAAEQREEKVVSQQVTDHPACMAGDVDTLATMPSVHEGGPAEGQDDETDHRPRPEAAVEYQLYDTEPDQRHGH